MADSFNKVNIPVYTVNGVKPSGSESNVDLGKTITLNDVYPIGSLYFNAENVNPAKYFGGKWVAFSTGRMLVGAGVGTDDNAYQMNFEGGTEGGEYSHSLEVEELAKHGHDGIVKSINLSNVGTVSSSPMENSVQLPRAEAQAEVDSLYLSEKDSLLHSHEVSVNSTGKGKAHNNLPPYIVVYIWKRVE